MKPDQSAQSCVVAVSQPCPDLIIILTSHSYNRDYITKTQKKSLLKLIEVVMSGSMQLYKLQSIVLSIGKSILHLDISQYLSLI